MKKMSVTFIVMIICCSATLVTYADQDTKPFKIKVTTTKGKPYRSSSNAPSYAFLQSEMKPYMLDKNGTCSLNVSTNDTVYFAFSTYTGLIPVAGLDSILISIDKNKLYAPNANGGSSSKAFRVIQSSEITTPMNSVDVENIAGSYRDLAQLIQGRFPGVYISQSNEGGYVVNIRGASSLKGTTSPLVLVDGSQSDFDMANAIDINDIKSLEILKDGASYGVRGANGVIIIQTKGYKL